MTSAGPSIRCAPSSEVARTVQPMVPETPIESYFFLPDTVRSPRFDELDEDSGLGYFHNVWLVEALPAEDVRRLLEWERASVRVIGEIAESSEGFDRLARVVDTWCTDCDWDLAVEHPELSAHEREVVAECVDSPGRVMEEIDLGVTALVAALATTGFTPAASCRGHVGDGEWARVPTVVFAGDRERVAALEPLVLGECCNLDDSGNGECLVALHAPSVLATMRLAESILGS